MLYNEVYVYIKKHRSGSMAGEAHFHSPIPYYLLNAGWLEKETYY